MKSHGAKISKRKKDLKRWKGPPAEKAGITKIFSKEKKNKPFCQEKFSLFTLQSPHQRAMQHCRLAPSLPSIPYTSMSQRIRGCIR
jgi:hypothetical protein